MSIQDARMKRCLRNKTKTASVNLKFKVVSVWTRVKYRKEKHLRSAFWLSEKKILNEWYIPSFSRLGNGLSFKPPKMFFVLFTSYQFVTFSVFESLFSFSRHAVICWSNKELLLIVGSEWIFIQIADEYNECYRLLGLWNSLQSRN